MAKRWSIARSPSGTERAIRSFSVSAATRSLPSVRWRSFCDDEAFKKSFTDAITNALKLIGVGADVHMGLFEDSKYVAEVAKEFSEEKDSSSAGRAQYIAQAKAKIADFPDGDLRIRAWWEGEKQARRDFDLSAAEVDQLKALVIAKLPKQEKAA
jgi:hypothetical protein